MWTGLPIAFSLLNPSVSLSGDELRAQIEHESGGVIFLASKEALRYSYHYQPGLRVVEPDPVLDPEVAQQFFALDTKKFILSENKDNFLDAKETYFRKLPYSFSKKQFVQSQTTLSDWEASIIHLSGRSRLRISSGLPQRPW